MGRVGKEKKSGTGYNQNGYVCLKLIELSLEWNTRKKRDGESYRERERERVMQWIM